MKKLSIVICLLLTSTGCLADKSGYGSVNHSVQDVSIIALIASPDKYDDKPVRIIGVINLEFEGNEICLHKVDLERQLTKNCLWIGLDTNALGASEKELRKFNGHYVLVEGIFDKDDDGHMGLSSGSIARAWRVSLWSVRLHQH